jgi:hypothetical protein
VEAYMLTGMSRHGRTQREAYLLPFLCEGACARGDRGGMGPFRDLSSTPESGSDPRGRARRSHLLGIRGGETCARRVGRGVTPSRGIERAGDLFCWAGLGRSCVHDYFRRAKADVFWLMPYGYRIIGTRQLLTVNYNLPIHSAQFQLTLLED